MPMYDKGTIQSFKGILFAQPPIGRRRFQAAQEQLLSGISPSRNFGPVIDGQILEQYPLDAIQQGQAAHIPTSIGTNHHETNLFAALDARLTHPDKRILTQIFGSNASHGRSIQAGSVRRCSSARQARSPRYHPCKQKPTSSPKASPRPNSQAKRAPIIEEAIQDSPPSQ
jgi:carboxylesterase type B